MKKGLIGVEQYAVNRTISGIPACDINIGQTGATIKHKIPKGSDAAGNGHAGQTFAAAKCPSSNGCNAAGDGDTGQIYAITECVVANGCNAILNIYGVYLLKIVGPRYVNSKDRGVIRHFPCALNGQGAIVVRPSRAGSAGAGGVRRECWNSQAKAKCQHQRNC